MKQRRTLAELRARLDELRRPPAAAEVLALEPQQKFTSGSRAPRSSPSSAAEVLEVLEELNFTRPRGTPPALLEVLEELNFTRPRGTPPAPSSAHWWEEETPLGETAHASSSLSICATCACLRVRSRSRRGSREVHVYLTVHGATRAEPSICSAGPNAAGVMRDVWNDAGAGGALLSLAMAGRRIPGRLRKLEQLARKIDRARALGAAGVLARLEELARRELEGDTPTNWNHVEAVLWGGRPSLTREEWLALNASDPAR